ncbi:hypothetical protein AMR41_20240 [Hapalosiphon sp. MRB220]|nr:hypothetical protein AMR41_20240 [Hapalosiphon sp. MRB220]
MKMNIKIALVVATITGATLFHFAEARAGVNVNETDNSVLCKGETSCTWLKAACGKEGGNYTDAGEYGKCNFPATSKINDFTAPSSSPTPNVTTSPIRQR